MDNAAIDLSGLEGVFDEVGSSESKVPVVTATVDTPLLPEHIAEYLQTAGKLETAQKSHAKDLTTLRARHHNIARLLAQGLPEGIVAELAGIDRR